MTTVLAIKSEDEVVIGGDGQVSFGSVVLKHKASKVRKIYQDKVLVGFAGSVADALSLFDRFEGYLQKHAGNLLLASINLAKEWRLDKALRRLEALMIVADINDMFLLSGSGEVIEPDDNILAIGSGSSFALAAAYSMLSYANNMSLSEIVKNSLQIASKFDIYTNSNIILYQLKK